MPATSPGLSARRFALLGLVAALLALTWPAYAQAVTADVIVLVDTSLSMQDHVDAMCSGLPQVERGLSDGGIQTRIRLVGARDMGGCVQDTVASLAPGPGIADDDWGAGIVRLAAADIWLPGARRLIIPLSNAGPASSNPVEDPGPDRDTIAGAIRAASDNQVAVSPLIARPNPDASAEDRSRLDELAHELAFKTGGRVVRSSDPADLPGAIDQLIRSSIAAPAGLTAIAASITTPGKIALGGVMITNAVLAALLAVALGLTAWLSRESFAARADLPSNRATRWVATLSARFRPTARIALAPGAWTMGSASLRRIVTAVLLAVLFAIDALIAMFLDPNLDATTAEGRTAYATILAALALANLAAVVGAKSAARARRASSAVKAQPAAILLVLLCVLVSRGLHFLPGYLLGLPAGLAILAVESDRSREAATGRSAILAALIVGAAAWLLSWPLDMLTGSLSVSTESGATAAAIGAAGAVQSALLTTFLIAVEFALFDLMPIGRSTGRLWAEQRRPVWGLVFGLVTFAALETFINPTQSGLAALRVPGLLPLVAVAAIYSGATLVAWLLRHEAQIREPGQLSRRSASVALMLVLFWLIGITCFALAAVAGAAGG